MSTRTLCLSLLVLLSTAFPGQALRLAKTRLSPHVTFSVALLAVAGLAVFLAPVSFRLPNAAKWYAIALGAGLVAPFAEYVVGAIALRRFGRLVVHERSGSVLTSAGAAVAEETIFRGIWLPMLGVWLVTPVAVGITSVVYGFNHLYFGWLAVLQKTLTGVGFGVLFVLSGHSVLVPMLAHVVQNFVVLLVLQRRAAS